MSNRNPIPPTTHPPATTGADAAGKATNPKRMAELLRHTSASNREQCGISLTHGYAREIADLLDAQARELAAARASLAACRAALYDFAHKTSVLPDSRHAALADKFAAEIEAAVAGTAALADAGRAGAEGG